MPIIVKQKPHFSAGVKLGHPKNSKIAKKSFPAIISSTPYAERVIIPAITHYGNFVTLLLPDKEIDWTVARQRNVAIHLEIMLSPLLFELKDAQRHQTFILEECARYFDGGKLTIHISKSMPLVEAANAHAEIESGTTTGKIVLTM